MKPEFTRSAEAAGPVVYVVDDDPSFLRAIVRRIEAAGLKVIGFQSAAAFLQAQPRRGPACAVIDLRMPDIDGLALQQQVAASVDPMPLIFLTGHGDIETSVKAMKKGAVDFLLKPVEGEHLLEAIRNALSIDREARRHRQEIACARARYATLTPRERQVLGLVVQGLLNKQIAGHLGTSERTVKAHRAQVMQKTRAASVAELVRFAGLLKELQPDDIQRGRPTAAA